jgi:hypothetical protein
MTLLRLLAVEEVGLDCEVEATGLLVLGVRLF